MDLCLAVLGNSLAVRPLSEQERLTLQGGNLLGQAGADRDLDFPVVGHFDSDGGGIRWKVTGLSMGGWIDKSGRRQQVNLAVRSLRMCGGHMSLGQKR